MDTLHFGAIVGGLMGGLIGGWAVLRHARSLPEHHCPNCGERFPDFRRPATLKQMRWGGDTCARCGCQTDRRGAPIG
jgi:hypothetical protein